MHVIGIIGAGFSGTMLAVHLLRAFPRGSANAIKLVLIDPADSQGIAYGTNDHDHLLNVPAGKMSAFEEDPQHLINYLEKSIGSGPWEKKFIPRAVFSEYVRSILDQEQKASGVILERVKQEARFVKRKDDLISLQLQSEVIDVHHLVLAFGNIHLPFAPAKSGSVSAHPAWPLPIEALKKKKILLVGTGLTMIDVAISASKLNPDSQIYALSRRGLLPEVHREANLEARKELHSLIAIELATKPVSVRGLLNLVRSLSLEFDWQDVIDSLRSFTITAWSELTSKEKKRFFRHLNTFWSIHRHRVCPDVNSKLIELFTSGRLEVIPGAIGKVSESEGIKLVDIELKTGLRRELEVNEIVNCTGPANFRKLSAHPFFSSLLGEKLISEDEFGIGISRRGSEEPHLLVSDRVSSFGPPLRGELLECTAVPELRRHALELSNVLIRKFGGPTSKSA